MILLYNRLLYKRFLLYWILTGEEEGQKYAEQHTGQRRGRDRVQDERRGVGRGQDAAARPRPRSGVPLSGRLIPIRLLRLQGGGRSGDALAFNLSGFPCYCWHGPG